MDLPPKQQSSFTDALTQNGLASRIRDVYTAFAERREALGLPNPGTVENIAKEVQRDVHLNSMSFSGLRADLTKAFSVSPLFQVSHSLSMGSLGAPYTYAALYGSPQVFAQANIDNDLSFSGRLNWRWSANLITKTSGQFTPQGNMLSIENDYTGADFTASLKAINPSVLDEGITGTIMASYLQSVTPRLALGIDAIWNRVASAYPPEMMTSYALRYKGDDWIASAQLLAAQGAVEASYWRKLSPKVETGINMNLSFVGMGAAGPAMGMKKEGTVTIGAKYEFTHSSFRAQIDNSGKVACFLEKVVAPPIRVTFSGEIDQKQSASNAAKLGLAVSIDAPDEEVMAQQEKVQSETQLPIPF